MPRPDFTKKDTLAAVLKTDPHWDSLPADVPQTIRRLLHRCLHNDPKQRLRDIGEARIQIDEVLGGTAQEPEPRAISNEAPRWRRALPWGGAALALLVGVVGTLAWRSMDREQPTPVYASLDAPAGSVLGEDDVVASDLYNSISVTPWLFAAGARLGPFEVLSALGAGGWAKSMARGTKLNRGDGCATSATRPCNAAVMVRFIP